MAHLFTNNAATTLSGAITAGATSLTVQTGAGALFPSPTAPDDFLITLVRASDGAIEIAQCTARSGDTLTVARAQEGTNALALAGGDKVELRVTAGFLNPLGSGPLAGFRNRIINGDFRVWQRGTSFAAAAGNYTADRWRNDQVTTVTQVADTPIAGASLYCLDVSYGSTSYGTITQRIESQNCYGLQGQSATLSFWAKSISGGAAGLSCILRTANAVDNFSAVTQQSSVGLAASVSTSWTKYSTTFTSLPAAVLNGIEIALFSGNGSLAGEIRYDLVQFELGSIATPFENRPIGVELALCQRFYYRIQSTAYHGPAFSNATNVNGRCLVKMPQTMRVAPSSLEQSGTAADYRILFSGVLTNCSAVPTFDNSSVDTVAVLWSATAGHTAGQGGAFSSNTTNGFLGFGGAEL